VKLLALRGAEVGYCPSGKRERGFDDSLSVEDMKKRNLANRLGSPGWGKGADVILRSASPKKRGKLGKHAALAKGNWGEEKKTIKPRTKRPDPCIDRKIWSASSKTREKKIR